MNRLLDCFERALNALISMPFDVWGAGRWALGVKREARRVYLLNTLADLRAARMEALTYSDWETYEILGVKIEQVKGDPGFGWTSANE